jgi:hypothetical protein
MRGFARVCIVALVDEVTGYQYFRARQFISKKLRKWAKTFPDEFYERMFKPSWLAVSTLISKKAWCCWALDK